MKKFLLVILFLGALVLPLGHAQALTATYTWSNPSNTHWLTSRYVVDDGGNGPAYSRVAASAGNKLFTSYNGNTGDVDVAVFELPIAALNLPTGIVVIDDISLSFTTTATADSSANGVNIGIYHHGANPSEEADDQVLYDSLDDYPLVLPSGGSTIDPSSPVNWSIPWDGIEGNLNEAINNNETYYSIALIADTSDTTNEIDATQGATLTLDYHLLQPVVNSLVVSTSTLNEASAGSYFYATTTFSIAMSTTTTPTLTFSPNVVSSGTLTFSSGSWSSGDTVYTARYTVADVSEEQSGIDIGVSGAVSSAANGAQTMTAATSSDKFNVDTIAPGTPSPSPAAGTYSGTQSVALSSTGSNSIRYTADGVTNPTCSTGIAYTTAISVSADTTIKAIGCDTAGNFSNIATLAYTITAGGGGSDEEDQSAGTGSSGGASAARRAAIAENQYVPGMVAPDPNIDPQVLASAPIMKALEEVIERLMFLISLLLSLHL